MKDNPPSPKVNRPLHEMLGQDRRDSVPTGFPTNAYPENRRGIW
jgi:hypothetical protein